MSIRRSKLFNYLRLLFFSNLALSFFVFGFWFYTRSKSSDYKQTISNLSAINIRLSADLRLAHNILTNRFFNYASAFASNVVVSSRSTLPQSLQSLPALDSNPLPSRNNKSDVELPPIEFVGYFEIDGRPFIKVRNKIFAQGDYLLGYPIQQISPDVVQYRDKFFKVSGGVE